jgi:type II secretory pathway component PulK
MSLALAAFVERPQAEIKSAQIFLYVPACQQSTENLNTQVLNKYLCHTYFINYIHSVLPVTTKRRGTATLNHV